MGYNFHDQPSIFMALSCKSHVLSPSYGISKYTMLKLFADSNYSQPSPDWLFTNQSWSAEQLALYYKNRTGKRRALHAHKRMT